MGEGSAWKGAMRGRGRERGRRGAVKAPKKGLVTPAPLGTLHIGAWALALLLVLLLLVLLLLVLGLMLRCQGSRSRRRRKRGELSK